MRGSAWRTFVGICAAMEHPDFELTLEEFSVFYAMFQRARRSGAPFDPAFIERVEALNQSAVGGWEDGDDDISVDDGQEDDDPDNDREDSDEIGGGLNPDPSPLRLWREIQAERCTETKSPDDRPILAEEPATGLTPKGITSC